MAFPPPFPLIVRGHSEVLPGNDEPQFLPPETDPQLSRPWSPRGRPGTSRDLRDGQHAQGLRSLTQQLLVYLSLHRRGAIADELADALLPGLALERARRRISRALSEARSELGDVIVRSGDVYALDPTAVAIDIDEFDFLSRRRRRSAARPRAALRTGACARPRQAARRYRLPVGCRRRAPPQRRGCRCSSAARRAPTYRRRSSRGARRRRAGAQVRRGQRVRAATRHARRVSTRATGRGGEALRAARQTTQSAVRARTRARDAPSLPGSPQPGQRESSRSHERGRAFG